jgi:predicted  nucleic acid-binding Zn-ribbon protein
MKVEKTNNINSKLLELQQKLRNVELAIDLYEKDLYKIDKRLEKIENEGEE